jgi:hypothetical protein
MQRAEPVANAAYMAAQFHETFGLQHSGRPRKDRTQTFAQTRRLETTNLATAR